MDTQAAEPGVWVFNGEGGRFPSGVFTSLEAAKQWIAVHSLSGVLTWYPTDVGIYEWVIEKGRWKPTKGHQSTPEFIQTFSSAYTGHHHFENGQVC